MASEASGLRLVGKTVDVLDLLATNRHLSVAELCQLTGEPRSSLYRLLRRLEQLNLVESMDIPGRFRLGVQLLQWGAATRANLDINSLAEPIMNELRKQTGLTVFLVIERDGKGVCVERLAGVRVDAQVLQLGGSLPLHAGAGPRALLAYQPEEAWHRYIEEHPLDPITPLSPATPDELLGVLRADFERGYTLSHGDVLQGLAAVGAPIYEVNGQVAAALSVSGLDSEIIGSQQDMICEKVAQGAQQVSSALGFEATHETDDEPSEPSTPSLISH